LRILVTNQILIYNICIRICINSEENLQDNVEGKSEGGPSLVVHMPIPHVDPFDFILMDIQMPVMGKTYMHIYLYVYIYIYIYIYINIYVSF
jgi:CheY-like chemotaxis protein